jgi:esterase/lipase superfamily enzyme
MRLSLVLVLALVWAIPNSISCAATDEKPDAPPYITGRVFSKEKSEPLADALVILAEQKGEGDSDPYIDITSVLTDSNGRFIFSCPHLWEKHRPLVLLVWKHMFSWATYPVPNDVLMGIATRVIEIYLAPLYLDQNVCPTCAVAPASHPMEIFYATDRQPTGGRELTFLNAPDPGGQLHYGVCDAGIEGASARDPIAIDKGFAKGFHAYRSRAEFYDAIDKQQLRDVLVYIHGFDNSLDGACATAAQLGYNIRFQGPVLIYSWPSNHDVSKYREDEQAIQPSIPLLRDFMRELSSRPDRRLHLLAHSMGNRALLAALPTLVGGPQQRADIQDVVFAAPDVGSKDFEQKLVSGTHARRATLYASSRDLALCLSEKLNKEKRAGDADPEIDTAPGLDSIDASQVDDSLIGHSYFSENRSVLVDIRMLIQDSKAPAQRYGLDRKSKASGVYWVINPSR